LGVPEFPPHYNEDEPVYRPLNEIWEQELRKIMSLEKREFWYKRRGNSPAVKLRTLDMPDIERTPQVERAIAQLTETVMAKYGRSKAEVAAEIAARRRVFGSGGSSLNVVEE
jgi:hypothetical protein